jgi:transcriptional/translational regulatory protein YebC/TACO1
MLPENTVEIDDVDMAARIIKLIDLLEDHDDVQNVYTNMSVTDEVMEKLD